MRKLWFIPLQLMLTAFVLTGCGGVPAGQAPAAPTTPSIPAGPTTAPASGGSGTGNQAGDTSTVTPVALPTLAPPAPPATSPAQLATPLPATVRPASQQTRPPVESARPSNRLVIAARQALARQLGVPENQLTLQRGEAKDWPDGGLGCPAPGVMYVQVLVPGSLLVFSNGQQTYAVHTDSIGARMILCENGQPSDLPGASQSEPGAAGPNQPVPVPPAPTGESAQLDPTSAPMVELARQALAKELGIQVDAVKLVQLEAVEWNDGSLGCPKPGVMYLQVITPGYRVILEAQGKQYTYHTDTRRQVVPCG